MTQSQGLKQEEKKNGFVMLPRWLFESPLLSGNQRLFCLSLAYHRNNDTHLCCPGRPTICREATISEDTYYSIRGRLKRIGLIDYEESVGGRGQSVRFVLNWLDGSKEEIAKLKAILKGNKPPQKDTGLDTINPPKRTQVNPPKRTHLTITNSNKNKYQQQQEKPAAVPPSFSPFSEEATLINRIIKLGIPQKKAKTLLVRHGKAAVTNQLEWLPQRNLKNPAGAFITALKDNWPEPVRSEPRGAKRRGEESLKYKRLYSGYWEDQEKIWDRALYVLSNKGECKDLEKLLTKLDPIYRQVFDEEWRKNKDWKKWRKPKPPGEYNGLED